MLGYSSILSIDLLRTYLFVNVINNTYGRYREFTLRDIVVCLGHHENDTEQYQRVRIYLDLLERWELIYLNKGTKVDNNGMHYVYTVFSLKEKSKILHDYLE